MADATTVLAREATALGALAGQDAPRVRDRSRAISQRLRKLMDLAFVLDPTSRDRREDDLRCFSRRVTPPFMPMSVRIPPGCWRHLSGICVSEMAREIGVESAERALGICDDIVSAFVAAPRPSVCLEEWASVSRGRMKMVLQG